MDPAEEVFVHEYDGKEERPSLYFDNGLTDLLETMKEVDEDAVMLKAELDRIKQERAKNIIKPMELNVYKVPEGLELQGPTLQLIRKAQFQDKIWGPPPDARLLQESDDDDDDEDPGELTHATPSYPGHSTQTQPGSAALCQLHNSG